MKEFIIKYLRVPAIATALAALFLLACAKEEIVYAPELDIPNVDEGVPFVRVLIIERAREVDVEARSILFIKESTGGRKGAGIRGEGRFKVVDAGGYLSLVRGGNVILSAERIFARPAGGGNIRVDGKAFRGSMQFTPASGGFSVINYIMVDDYIKGVLPAEIGYLGKDKYEAYRAQAISSRSYSLSKLEQMKDMEYDLRATVMDQVYKGVAGESPLASRAVEDTRGIVLLWDGKPAKAYYSSCCGGHTADIRVGWPWKDEFPYLYGVRDATEKGSKISFCRHSRHFRWRADWKGGKLAGILNRTLKRELKSGFRRFNSLIDIRISGYSRDGRVKSLEIVTDSGLYEIIGDRIRWVLRPFSHDGAILRSTLFKIDVIRERGKVRSLSMLGGGNGHGIGMCQTGAIRMAEIGYSAEEILSHYYPGASIEIYY